MNNPPCYDRAVANAIRDSKIGAQTDALTDVSLTLAGVTSEIEAALEKVKSLSPALFLDDASYIQFFNLRDRLGAAAFEAAVAGEACDKLVGG